VAEYDLTEFYEGLVEHGLILPVGVQGAFGRGSVFEEVLNRFNDLVTREAKGDGAEPLMFPPIIPRATLEKSEFLKSMPQLAGSVFSFFGNEKQHQELLERVHGGLPWDDTQKMTEVVLTPAACYPVYPRFAGTIDGKEGRLVDILNWVFRHEPSPDPTRLQAFRMRELVRLGTAEQVATWRNGWLERGMRLLESLGLPVHSDRASDPFFGRGGRLMAASQREQALKFEVLIPIVSKDKPTACCSFNYHQDHFGKIFDIKLPSGETAHTACLGFGLERVTMALFKAHGFDPDRWPAEIRARLWP
jgi:seryl-tRNA synthetase